jgi:hypothetical protein
MNARSPTGREIQRLVTPDDINPCGDSLMGYPVLEPVRKGPEGASKIQDLPALLQIQPLQGGPMDIVLVRRKSVDQFGDAQMSLHIIEHFMDLGLLGHFAAL